MLRKVLTVSVAALFLTSSAIVASPANAATVKSGQSCKKVNTSTKVKFKGETYVYKCVKNPLYQKTKLTWTLQECLTAIKELNQAKSDLAAQKAAGVDNVTVGSYQQLADMSKELADMSCAKGI